MSGNRIGSGESWERDRSAWQTGVAEPVAPFPRGETLLGPQGCLLSLLVGQDPDDPGLGETLEFYSESWFSSI